MEVLCYGALNVVEIRNEMFDFYPGLPNTYIYIYMVDYGTYL